MAPEDSLHPQVTTRSWGAQLTLTSIACWAVPPGPETWRTKELVPPGAFPGGVHASAPEAASSSSPAGAPVVEKLIGPSPVTEGAYCHASPQRADAIGSDAN